MLGHRAPPCELRRSSGIGVVRCIGGSAGFRRRDIGCPPWLSCARRPPRLDHSPEPRPICCCRRSAGPELGSGSPWSMRPSRARRCRRGRTDCRGRHRCGAWSDVAVDRLRFPGLLVCRAAGGAVALLLAGWALIAAGLAVLVGAAGQLRRAAARRGGRRLVRRRVGQPGRSGPRRCSRSVSCCRRRARHS